MGGEAIREVVLIMFSRGLSGRRCIKVSLGQNINYFVLHFFSSSVVFINGDIQWMAWNHPMQQQNISKRSRISLIFGFRWEPFGTMFMKTMKIFCTEEYYNTFFRVFLENLKSVGEKYLPGSFLDSSLEFLGLGIFIAETRRRCRHLFNEAVMRKQFLSKKCRLQKSFFKSTEVFVSFW